MNFTHVVNPFNSVAGTEHDIAQRVTCVSMREAVDFANRRGVQVEIFGVEFEGDPVSVEPPVRPMPLLTRSVLDFRPMKPSKRLPLLTDLLAAADQYGTGKYVIYTNIDISLQPNFYTSVQEMIDRRDDPFAGVINRRTIGRYTSPDQLTEMCHELGKMHPGYDCFIFPRAWIARIDLGKTCIGARHFDGLLIANLDLLSNYRLEIFRDLRLTFHIGDDQTWASRLDYDEYNMRETIASLRHMACKNPPRPGTHYAFLHAGYMRNGLPHYRFMRMLKRIRPLRWLWKRCRDVLRLARAREAEAA